MLPKAKKNFLPRIIHAESVNFYFPPYVFPWCFVVVVVAVVVVVVAVVVVVVDGLNTVVRYIILTWENFLVVQKIGVSKGVRCWDMGEKNNNITTQFSSKFIYGKINY